MPTVRKPAAAATVTSSGGVVSRTVRWARDRVRDGWLTGRIVPPREAARALWQNPGGVDDTARAGATAGHPGGRAARGGRRRRACHAGLRRGGDRQDRARR